MIRFLWHKMFRNKWLTLCLIMGNVLLIGIVSGIPMYMTAVSQRILQQDLRSIRDARNTFPATMSLRYNFNIVDDIFRVPTFYETRDVRWPMILDELDIPSEMSFLTYIMGPWSTTPVVRRDNVPRDHQVMIGSTGGFEEHITLTHGRMPVSGLVDGNTIEALAMLRVMTSQDLLLDELLEVTHIADREPLFVRVVGVYEPAYGSEAFWSVSPIDLRVTLLVHEELIYDQFIPVYRSGYRLNVYLSEVLDFTELVHMDIHHYIEVITRAMEFYNATPIWFLSQNITPTLIAHYGRPDRLEETLWVLQLPIFVMLALFIYMVMRQVLQTDRNDISVLASRGAGRRQIIGIYIMQGLFIGFVSYPLGILLGIGMCLALGASSGFLEMVQREALRVFITREALLFGLGAFSFSFINMFIPVIGFSKIGIVENKRKRSGKPRKSLWQRYFIDILLLGAGIYGIYHFSNILVVAEVLHVTGEIGIDPLLYFSSSLFILGAGLFCLRLFPYIVRIIYYFGQKLWSPAVYASMIKVIRSAGEEQFIMLFLIFTVAIGIYSAQAARTINTNNDHLIMYSAGADLTFREIWGTNITLVEEDETGAAFRPPMPDVIMYVEPNFERYLHFDEVNNLTRVIRRYSSVGLVTAGGLGARQIVGVEVMGIETNTFGETIWFRDDLLMVHINYYLNVLASRADGVLLSRNFKDSHGMEIGDTINIIEHVTSGDPQRSDFTVVGFVDFWPGFLPYRNVVFEGQPRQVEAYLAVANFGNIEMNWGIRPYEVWMDLNTDSSRFFHEFLAVYNEGRGGLDRINIVEFSDTMSSMVEIRSNPIVQGTNGVFTVGFLMILVVCITGFLIYWILSIRARVLQFGIFRAMGMSVGNISSLLVNEQVFITLTAILIGTIVGELASYFFVPLVQLSFAPAEQVIPLLVVMESRDYFNIFMSVGAAILLCLLVIIRYVAKIKIDQALKLGED